MAESLIANANGKYYENLSHLIGKPNQVKVIVEDEQDSAFWYDILSSVVPDKTFDINPYHYNQFGQSDLAKGKLHILQLARENLLGKNYWGCVDSDYDYLLSKTSNNGQLLQTYPYLLQTYAYSIENLLCCAETLEGICFKANKVNPQFDFIQSMKRISNILYPLLIWSLYLQSQDIYEFTTGQWKHIFSCNKKISTHTMEDILQSLRENVQQKLVEILLYFKDEIDNKNAFEEELLKQYEIDPNNCYLYVRGHDIHKYILNVFLKAIQAESKRQYIKEIKASGASPKVIENNINHYHSTLIDIEVLLSTNYDYKNHCPLIFNKIKKDILFIA